jgi:2-isopropylmalate synthase
VRAVSAGGDAQGHASLTARHAERDWRGHGMSTDIVEATAQAALAIVNRIDRQSAQGRSGAPIEACGHGRPPLDPRAQGSAPKEHRA